LFAEFLELLVAVLEVLASEAALFGLVVNWQKTVVQALGSSKVELFFCKCTRLRISFTLVLLRILQFRVARYPLMQCCYAYNHAEYGQPLLEVIISTTSVKLS